MPRLQPRQLGVGCAGTAFSHFGEAEIDTIGKDGGEEQAFVGGRFVTFEVSKVTGEVSPTIHFHQQFGDLQVGHERRNLTYQCFGFCGDGIGQWSHLETAVSYGCVRQFVLCGQSFDITLIRVPATPVWFGGSVRSPCLQPNQVPAVRVAR